MTAPLWFLCLECGAMWIDGRVECAHRSTSEYDRSNVLLYGDYDAEVKAFADLWIPR